MYFKDFSTEDFIADEQFIDWVKTPNTTSEAFWSEAMTQHPELQESIQQARTFILGLEFEQPKLENTRVDEMLHQIHLQMNYPKTESSTRMVGKWWRIAASVLLISTTLGMFLWWKNTTVIYQTTFVETKSYTLPDQSEVVLNANSRLKTKASWKAGQDRVVWLDGEAFFSVTEAAENQGAKFIVQAGEASVEVLGTKFNVNSRPENIRVLITEGKVSVKLPGKEAEILEKLDRDSLDQDLIEYQTAKKTLERKKVKPQPYISWKDRILKFENTPLTELVRILEDNYGFEVEVAHPDLMEESLSGSMPYGDAELVFKALQTVFDIEVQTLSDKKILLRNAQK